MKTFEGRSLHIQYSRPKNSKKKKKLKDNILDSIENDESGDEAVPEKSEDIASSMFLKVKLMSSFEMGEIA